MTRAVITDDGRRTASLSMGAQRSGHGWVGERRPARALHAGAAQRYRRRPRLGVLRQGGTLLVLLAGLFAALQRERAVVAQCTGGGLSDEVLCRALGKECGEIAGGAHRVLLYTPCLGCFRLYILLTGPHAVANDLCVSLIADSCGTTITCPACEDNMICIDHSCCHPFPTCDDLESDCGYVEGAPTLIQKTVFVADPLPFSAQAVATECTTV